MKVTYNWLKDFVEIKMPAQELADKLTMAGLEVTSLEEKEGDFIFEIEVTSNRPDCLSVAGIAREVAVITKSKIKNQKSKLQCKIQKFKNIDGPLKIEIENKKDCPLYTAKIIRNVAVKPSPGWLRKRLESVGCRSVNNIVDITNYVLFEYGEPLHAFDLDKLTPGFIAVRRAKNQERLVTIDGQERILTPEILIIADKEGPVAIAGVMGGKDTEVSWNTRNILLEAAIFNSILVRHSRQGLGLESESAYRFERGVAPEIVEAASWRAVGLTQELTGARCVLAKSQGATKPKQKVVNLSIAGANKILGHNISGSKMKNILQGLEFKVGAKIKDVLAITVPSHRQDIILEIDLIEEIARIYGYNRIPASIPKAKPDVSGYLTMCLISKIKNILVGLGLYEVITYSLLDKVLLKGITQEEAAIAVLNPLSKEQGFLRPTIIPGLLSCVALNLNQKQDPIRIFEIAKAFIPTNSGPKEELVLGVALCGTKSLLLSQGLIKESLGILHLKGIVEVLFERLNIKDYCLLRENAPSEIGLYIKEDKVGRMMDVPDTVLDRFGIKNKNVLALEASLEKLIRYVRLEKIFEPPAKYPDITRDISILLKEEAEAEAVLQTIREEAGPLLAEAKITDYYKGKQIPAGSRGLTISCVYRSDERTLTETEVNPAHSALCSLLSERFSAKIR